MHRGGDTKWSSLTLTRSMLSDEHLSAFYGRWRVEVHLRALKLVQWKHIGVGNLQKLSRLTRPWSTSLATRGRPLGLKHRCVLR